MKRGRPLLLGTLDETVQKFLIALRKKGGVVNAVVAIAAAKALISKSNNEHLKAIDLDSSYWGKRLFRRMGYVKKGSTTGRLEIPDGAKKEAGLIFHHRICKIRRKIRDPTFSNNKYRSNTVQIGTCLKLNYG